jgi:hypothetical protein
MHTRIHERTFVAVPWTRQIQVKDISFPIERGAICGGGPARSESNFAVSNDRQSFGFRNPISWHLVFFDQ